MTKFVIIQVQPMDFNSGQTTKPCGLCPPLAGVWGWKSISERLHPLDPPPAGDIRRPEQLPKFLECLLGMLFLGVSLFGCASSEYDLLLQAKSKNAVERQQALIELSQTGDVRYLPLFVAALSPEQPALVRATAVESLGQFREKEVLEPLTIALSDPSHYVRMESAEALGNFPEPSVIAALTARLEVEDHIWVKQKIIQALRLIGTDDCIEPLIKVIADPNESVSKNAQLALRSMTGHYYGKNLDQWNRWWTNYKVRKN